ncbi:hypothetical protein N7510_003808 [Penicillium lagena]|uniref:uncharacterized protein n=1 Tax=Penicillium lagena TaxID=94218 RepID=UPI002541C67D|nr:uncharacterized protein N7510_003808 [Penicillium lagena]KAJ5619824.1 hypothetical protein N7510_003808 [Penicillium lagena]
MNTCFGFLGVNVGMIVICHLRGWRAILMLEAMACEFCQLASAIAATVSPSTLPTVEVPARKFQSYECLIEEAARLDAGDAIHAKAPVDQRGEKE